jgi:hypothetical protein
MTLRMYWLSSMTSTSIDCSSCSIFRGMIVSITHPQTARSAGFVKAAIASGLEVRVKATPGKPDLGRQGFGPVAAAGAIAGIAARIC